MTDWFPLTNFSKEIKYQTTIRCLLVESNHQKRIELAKKIDLYIKQHIGLKQASNNQTTKSIYESFKKRTFKPYKAKSLILTDNQLLSLLGMRI